MILVTTGRGKLTTVDNMRQFVPFAICDAVEDLDMHILDDDLIHIVLDISGGGEIVKPKWRSEPRLIVSAEKFQIFIGSVYA